MTDATRGPATRRFVDTHLHSWDAIAQRHSWLDGLAELPRRPGLPAHHLVDDAGVAGIVLVEGGADRADVDAELDRLLELRRTEPRVLGVIGSATSARSIRSPREGIVGMRLNVRGWTAESKSIDEAASVFDDCASAGLPVDVLCSWEELSIVADAARVVPTASIMIDHLGGPPEFGTSGALEAMKRWRQGLSQAAASSTTHLKLSGLAARGTASRHLLNWAVDVFGAQRCVAGSDWPVTEQANQYGAWFTFLGYALGDRIDEGIAGPNAVRFYRLALPDS